EFRRVLFRSREGHVHAQGHPPLGPFHVSGRKSTTCSLARASLDGRAQVDSPLHIVEVVMRVIRLALPVALFALPVAIQPVEAQTRVVIGVESGYPAAYRRPPVRRYVAPRIVFVERVPVRGNRHGWWRNHGYRPVTLYYWRGRFYQHDLSHVATRSVVVYERGGRFYRAADHRYDRYDRFDRDDRYYQDDRYWYNERSRRYERDDRKDEDRYRDDRDRKDDREYRDRQEYRKDRD